MKLYEVTLEYAAEHTVLVAARSPSDAEEAAVSWAETELCTMTDLDPKVDSVTASLDDDMPTQEELDRAVKAEEWL